MKYFFIIIYDFANIYDELLNIYYLPFIYLLFIYLLLYLLLYLLKYLLLYLLLYLNFINLFIFIN